MVCAELGLGDACDFTNNAAYVAHWLQTLKSDRKQVFRAATDAQRIADTLLAFNPDYAGQGSQPGTTGEAADTGEPLMAEAA